MQKSIQFLTPAFGKIPDFTGFRDRYTFRNSVQIFPDSERKSGFGEKRGKGKSIGKEVLEKKGQERERRKVADMWCAMHVKDGNEARTEAFVSGLFPKELNIRCFHLTRSRRKKYGGQWRTIREILLPGYVFIDTDCPEEVHKQLRKTCGQELLFGGEPFVTTVKAQEAEFMELLMNPEGEIGLSEIRVEDDGQICCLSGPLRKVSHLVRKIDLHKRIAEVEAEFMGERQALYLGIVIAGEGTEPGTGRNTGQQGIRPLGQSFQRQQETMTGFG